MSMSWPKKRPLQSTMPDDCATTPFAMMNMRFASSPALTSASDLPKMTSVSCSAIAIVKLRRSFASSHEKNGTLRSQMPCVCCATLPRSVGESRSRRPW